MATRYREVVTSQLYDGKTQLNRALQGLIIAAETVLALDEKKRQQTLIRTDAGGGSDEDINFLLSRGYLLITKAYSSRRAEKVCQSVKTWYRDPLVEGREVGFPSIPHPYCQPTVQVGVRSRRKNGTVSLNWLVCNLSETQLQQVYYLPKPWLSLPEPILWWALGCYDLRGGG